MHCSFGYNFLLLLLLCIHANVGRVALHTFIFVSVSFLFALLLAFSRFLLALYGALLPPAAIRFCLRCTL